MQPIQFFAARAEDGALLPDASVDVFVHGTRERAPLFSDSPATIPLENPVRADANARVFFYTTAARIDIQIGRYGYVAPLLVDISTLDAATAVEYVRAEINKAINDAAVALVRMREEFAEFILSSGYEFVGDYDADGPLTLTRLNQIFRKDGEFWRARPTLGLPYTTLGNWPVDQPKFVPSGDAALRQDLQSADGAKRLVKGSLYEGESLTPAPIAGSSLSRGVVHAYYVAGAPIGSFRVGGSDLTDLNDEMGFWRGLPSRDAWGDPRNIGFASAAFNRNNAAFAAYSTGFGHDNVLYGTASVSYGAGCCTGNPDVTGTPAAAFTGYCSLAGGKNVYVPGEKAVGLGEGHFIDSRSGIGLGYMISSQPSAKEENPVGASGIGRDIKLYGQGYGFGAYISASDSMALGFGANPGSPLIPQNESEVALGSGTTVGAVRVQKPLPGRTRSQVWINRIRSGALPGDSIETSVDLGDGRSFAVVGDGYGTYTFGLRGLKNDGTSQPIVDFVWTNPNSGSSAGELAVHMNGRPAIAFGLLANGTPVFQELKDASGISGAPSGAIYKDGGVIKIVP